MSHECPYCDRQFDTERGLAVHKGRSHSEPWTDRSLFRELRIEKRLDLDEMADRWGCSRSTASRWGRKHGIDERELRPWKDEDKMRRLYNEEELTTGEIASKFNCSRSTVIRWMEKHGIERRTPMHRLNESISSGGYQFINYWKDGMQFGLRVHRVVAYAHGMIEFDELFDPSVVVHHKNDIPLINSPENLEAMRVGEHVKHHFEESQEG